jgi:hypothetical protein
MDETLRELMGTFLDDVENSQCIVVPDPEHFPPQTKLIITCVDDTVEFTILDCRECAVLVKDGRNFSKPVAGKLLGTRLRDPRAADSQWKILPGRLLRYGFLAYEVAGQQYYVDGMARAQIVYPSGPSYDVWHDS